MDRSEPAPAPPQGAPPLLRRRQRSLLGRLITVLGLAFFVVELVVLGVFTYFYWYTLRDSRKEHVGRYSVGVHDHVRRAYLKGPESGKQINENLDDALDAAHGDSEQKRAQPPAGNSYIPPAGPHVEVWVFTPKKAHRFTRSGQLLTHEESGWKGDPPPEVQAFLEGGRVASREEVYRDRIVRVEPLHSGSTGEETQNAVMYLKSSLVDIQRQVATYGLVAFGTGTLALLITAMVTLGYLRRALLVPLSLIIRADNAARRGEGSEALVDEGDIPDDEVGEIMRSRNHLFRAMTKAQRDLDDNNAELHRQREELAKWGRELEQLVQDKTAALLRARDTLYRTEKLAAVGRLAANVAHEINNPLASIAGYAEEARDELEGGATDLAEVARSLKTIEEQAFRCKDILKRLLGLARSDPITLHPVDLSRLARDTVSLAEHGARKRGVDIQVQLPAEGPHITSDEGSLQQVILNLVENATDAAVQGAGDPWVTLSHREDDEAVGLVVEDSGRGIPDAVRERVFDPFYTTKPVGRGTGLGLAICQSLVERLGGRIECESPRGSGAAFTVWLPRNAPPRRPSRALQNTPGTRTVDGSNLVEAQVRGSVGGADPDL